MKKDWMSTQTGGEGETIQATNPTPETPAQYDINIQPVQPPEPPSENSPVVQQTMVDVPKPIVTPEEIANKPKSDEVGYIDWFSGDAIHSALNEELLNASVEGNTDDTDSMVNNPLGNLDIPSLAPKMDLDMNDNPMGGFEIPSLVQPTLNTQPLDTAGVGSLPTLPIGADSEEFAKLRDKYEGYEIKSTAFGNVTATKKAPEKSTTAPPVKPKYAPKTPAQTGVILNYSKMPDNEYQTTGDTWLKRKKGTNSWQLITDAGSINTLNKEFGTKTPVIPIYKYPNKEADYVVWNDQWHIKEKGDWKWNPINDPKRIEELNRENKQNVKPISGGSAIVAKAGEITSYAGVKPDAKTTSAISKDSDGNAIISGNPTAQSLFVGKSNFGNQLISNPSSVYHDKRSGLENARDEELKYAQTQAQKDQVINHYSKLIKEADENEKLDNDFVRENNNAVTKNLSKPIVKAEKKVLDLSKEFSKSLSLEPSWIEEANQGKAQETINQAQSFAEIDLENWRKAYGNHLTEGQFSEFKKAQEKVKTLAFSDDISDEGLSALNKDISAITDQFNNSLKYNKEINQAAFEGKSVSEFQLDKKKRFASKIDAQLFEAQGTEVGISMIGRSKELFNATAAIHDFMIDYVKDGKVIEDKNGVFTIADGVSKSERAFIEGQLKKRIENYEVIKNLGYNTLQEDISNLSSKKKNLQSSIDYAVSNLSKLTVGSKEYKDAVGTISNAKKKLEGYNNQLHDMKNGQRTFFLTEPKEIVKTVAPFMNNSSAKSVFTAIDENLSPKQKFDMFYSGLAEENEALAQKHGIDVSRLDKFGANVRSMLDWETFGVNLSDEEKKFFANKKILYALAPMYLNNENGITQESAGFFESFGNTFYQTLLGSDIAASRGHMNQTQVVNEQLNKFYELGYTKEDLASGVNIKDLEDRKNVSWVSAEGAGEILAPTAAIMLELVASGQMLGAVGGLGKSLGNLIKTVDRTSGGTKAVGYGNKVATSLKAYETSLANSTKLGRYLKDPLEQGVQMEVAGNIFGSGEEELNLSSGFLGSFASQGITSMFSKLPGGKLIPVIQSIFGNQTDNAIKVFQKIGATASRGTGEVAEEFTQELTSIYQSTLDSRGFWDEVENRFGSFDQVMKFVTTSFTMGGAFNMVQSNTAADLYEKMPKEDQQKIDAVVQENRESIEDAQMVSERVAEQATQEIELDIAIDNDFKDQKTDSEVEAPKEAEAVTEAEVAIEEEVPVEAEQIEAVPEEVIPEDEIVETDAFDDYSPIKKLRSPIKKQEAITEFESKHGKGSYERVEKINTKFGNIVNTMIENKIIEKKC